MDKVELPKYRQWQYMVKSSGSYSLHRLGEPMDREEFRRFIANTLCVPPEDVVVRDWGSTLKGAGRDRKKRRA